MLSLLLRKTLNGMILENHWCYFSLLKKLYYFENTKEKEKL